jgi:Rieske Fe-S protein
MSVRTPLDVLGDPPSTGTPADPSVHPCFAECLSRRGFVSASTAALLSAALAACGGGGDGPTGTNGGGGGGGGNASLPAGVTVNGNTISIDLTQQTALANANGFLFVPSPGRVIVLNAGDTFRAYSSVCPHEQSDVSNFSNGRFTCPAHGSQFDATGRVVTGPAARDLTAATVNRSGNTLTVTRS